MRTVALAIALLLAIQAAPFGQGKKPWTAPRTPDGHPDLQGIWDYRSATPLQRPARFAGKEFLTPDEVVAYQQEALERPDGRPPDDARTEESVHPVWWLDYGKTVVKTRRTSLIVDPPDGRIPPLTPDAQKRNAARRAEAATHGPADSYENRSLFERCLTRGAARGPAARAVQQQPANPPDARLRGARYRDDPRRPHRADGWTAAQCADLRGWMGDSRGRWEGDTLVVDTVNFSDKISFRGCDRETAPRRTLHAARCGHARVPVHRRRSRHVDDALDRRLSDGEDHGEDLRVRVPRRELRPAEHPLERALGRTEPGGEEEAVARRPAPGRHA